MRQIINILFLLLGLCLGVGVAFSYAITLTDQISDWQSSGYSVSVYDCPTYVPDTIAVASYEWQPGSYSFFYASASCLTCTSSSSFFTQSQYDNFINTSSMYCTRLVPTAENGVQDNDEDGIDCGGTTGVDCVTRCPDGYVLDGSTCIQTTSPPDDLVGTELPDGSIVSSDDVWILPGMQADPILASPDTEISPDAWGYGDPGSSGPNLTTYTDPNDTVGDYVIRDDDGNIVGVKITGPSESTDNGDGTTTNVTTTTTYNQDTGQNQTTTTTTTTDNATGETLDSSTVSSGSSGTSGGVGLVGVGLGSTSGVTGDQYARGTDALTDAIEGTDEDGNTTTFTAPTDGVFQPPENDETEYDTDGFVDDYIGQYQDFGWLPLFTESRIETSSQTCSIDGYITLSGQSIPVSFSMCEFEGHFQSLGLMLAVVCQFYAIIIAFGGVD